jgi:hypothetical protein
VEHTYIHEGRGIEEMQAKDITVPIQPSIHIGEEWIERDCEKLLYLSPEEARGEARR